jgi:predicted transposase/invertase (TIGR01784 family)
MQMGWSESFKQRIQFGASKAYVSQLEAGEHYKLLQPVYGLALIGEIFKPTSDEWYHHFQMVNIKDTEDQIKGLELIFVELPKFKPTARWERHLGILWLRFLNEISTLEEIPSEMEDVPEISKAIQLTREAAYNEAELAEYDGYWDLISIEKTIKADAEEKGKIEGIEFKKALFSIWLGSTPADSTLKKGMLGKG